MYLTYDINILGEAIPYLVESQLYIGTSKEILHIFTDSKFSDKTIDENSVYEIEGTMCYFDTETWNRSREEYASDYRGLVG